MDDFQSTQMENPRIGRRTYLVTYSQADVRKFPTRESFGKMLVEHFNAGSGKAKVSHWAVFQEQHEDGGLHYHASLKLTGAKKWLKVKESINNDHGIMLNFSDSHNYYIAAYRYICKTDNQVYHSDGHPDLSDVGSPRTKKSTAAYRHSRKRIQQSKDEGDTGSHKPKLAKKLSNFESQTFWLEIT